MREVDGLAAVKIGYCNDTEPAALKRRLSDIQLGNPRRIEVVALWPHATQATEHAVHVRFASQRVYIGHRFDRNREWFYVNDDVQAWLDRWQISPDVVHSTRPAKISDDLRRQRNREHMNHRADERARAQGKQLERSIRMRAARQLTRDVEQQARSTGASMEQARVAARIASIDRNRETSRASARERQRLLRGTLPENFIVATHDGSGTEPQVVVMITPPR